MGLFCAVLCQALPRVTRPLCPTLIHDPDLRLAVCCVGLAACLVTLWLFMRQFSKP